MVEAMEIQKGFKQTEVGIIPSDWEVVTLGEIGDFKNGINKNKDAFGFGSPFVNLLNVFGKSSINKSIDLGLVNSNDTEKQLYSLKKGDVIFVRSSVKPSGVGLTILVKENLPNTVFSGFLIRFRDKGKISKEFKEHCFYEEGFRQRLVANSTVSANTNINQEALKNLFIPLPPTKAEQTAIATVLNDADALITQLEKLIAKKRAIKQGAMQELLKPKEGWEVKKLGEIAAITKLAGFEYTNYFNSYNDGGEIIVVRGTNITHNKMDLTDVKFIPRSTSNKLKRSKLRKDDLVFAYVGTIGPVFLIDENDKYHLGPNTSKITHSKELSPLYLFHYFSSSILKKEIIEHTSIGAQPSLSMFKIRNFKINLPPKKEQILIAQILSDMDAEIEALEKKLDKYKMVKQGMMQNLLTGRIRLV